MTDLLEKLNEVRNHFLGYHASGPKSAMADTIQSAIEALSASPAQPVEVEPAPVETDHIPDASKMVPEAQPQSPYGGEIEPVAWQWKPMNSGTWHLMAEDATEADHRRDICDYRPLYPASALDRLVKESDEARGGQEAATRAWEESSHAHDAARANFHTMQSAANDLTTRLTQAEASNARMREALECIKRWELPETGKFWENTDGTISDRPMSYEACNGSNGARDFIRRAARTAMQEAGNGA